MNQSYITRFLPYEADYKLLSKCRSISMWILIIISIFSIALPLIDYFNITHLHNVVNFLYFILIISYFILDIYTETFLYPATARKRRRGFIDNALGSKFLEKPVENYYTNDRIEIGPYKMIVNCGENCFFTLNIARKMTVNIVLKNIIFTLLFCSIAYLGIMNSLIAIPVMQILFSTLFLTELVHHINFVVKLNLQFERFKEVFQNKPNKKTIFQQALLLYLDYETTLAYNKAPLSDSVYNNLKEKLTREWEEIKNRYELEK